MPQPRYNVVGAMFDVKPVNQSGSVDVARIQGLVARINLRHAAAKGAAAAQKRPVGLNTIRPAVRPVLAKTKVLRELETSLNTPHDHRTLLMRAGALVQGGVSHARPRYRPIEPSRSDREQRYHQQIVAEVHHSRPQTTPPVLAELMPEVTPTLAAMPALESIPASSDLQHVDQWWTQSRPVTFSGGDGRRPWYRRKAVITFAALAILGLGVNYAFGLKDRVIQEGNLAVSNLQDAKEQLGNLDFAAASDSFLKAYQEFSKAGGTLNVLGANMGSLLATIPGGEKLKSAHSMVEIGKLIANTGQAMADAMAALSKTGILLNPQSGSGVPAAEVIGPLNTALGVADTNLKKVRVLLADVDTSIIPEDKRATFEEFAAQFPQLQQLVSQGSDFARFLESMVGVRGTKRYLILFQNSSELRPTGGFPGSYALLTFEKGKLKEYKVGDVYDIDGQMKELIIPPRQLQHITPTWALRDANWFIDFPSSAKKIMTFFKKETNVGIDGVITISPAVFQDILRIIGPIEMSAYKLTITADNFLATVQNEVEYGPNKKDNKPKKIIMDMAPVVMQRLAAADHNAWLNIFNALIGGLEHKDVLMHFRDLNLQSFALDRGFAGEVKPTDSDYLMITATNVKGAKADVVTDTVVKFSTAVSESGISHRLIMARTHNGGKTDYGFYNKPNPTFVRVLVPKGSTLTSITGQSIAAYQPLVTYDNRFQTDDDLARLEDTFRAGGPGVFTYEEAGKTGFAFWMVTDPGASRTVELEYTVPSSVVSSDYELYIQKQPGLAIQNFNFELSKPDDVQIVQSVPTLNHVGTVYTFTGKLERDIVVNVELR